MEDELHIRCFGGLQIARNHIPQTEFVSNKAPALLAYLAFTCRPHTRESLAALLWGEMPEADAKNNLRQALSNLRKLVEPFLTITRETIQFNDEAPYFLDVQTFLDEIQPHLGVSAEENAAHLKKAVNLYRGEFLEGFYVREAPDFEDWMLAQKIRCREHALQALHTLARFHEKRGEFTPAMEYAVRLLALDPWREEAHRQLMLLKARRGQRSAALAQFETCRRLLLKELGVEPSAETTALYERIRAAQHSPRHSLPAPPTAFVGRERELAELRRRLADPACRLLTITGTGGIGKTRLSLEIASNCTEMFINGAWFVPLADVEAVGLVPAIANAMDFTFGSGDHKKQLINFLRQKEALLVLDSFEHLLDSSALLSDILRSATEMKLLVTSRQRLDIEGEWVMELAGLETPQKTPDVALSAFSAARLFLQSAQRARAEFQPREQDTAAVAEICQLVGGLPLGIEIAAAWVRSLDCQTIAREIYKNLDFLASTRRDMPERQRSVRAVFESSWGKLSPVEKTAFARLSVFRGGFAAEAAAEVSGAPLTVIASLVDKSLVQRNADRFEMHEVMRQFTAEKLRAEEAWSQQARGAHCAFFACWAKTHGEMDERISFPLMHQELENVRFAWNWAVEQTDVTALANMLPFSKRYLDLQGRYHEGIELFQSALEGLGAPADASELPLDARSNLIARLLMYKAVLIADAGQPDASQQLLVSCLAFFRRASDAVQLAICLNGLGNAARFIGEEAQAAVYYREELDIARSLNDRHEEGTALNNLAIAVNTMGDFAEAERLHRECLALRREISDYPGVASSLINLGVVLYNQRRFSEAKPLLAEAIEISRQLNQTRHLAASLGNLGGILLQEGRYEDALAHFSQGLEIHRNSGYRFGMAIALDNVGTAHFHLGHEQEAYYYLRQSIHEARAIRAEVIILDVLVSMAGLRARHGEKEKALELIGLIRGHPRSDPESVAHTEKLCSQAADGLNETRVRAALERGKTLELENVVEDVLRG